MTSTFQHSRKKNLCFQKRVKEQAGSHWKEASIKQLSGPQTAGVNNLCLIETCFVTLRVS